MSIKLIDDRIEVIRQIASQIVVHNKKIPNVEKIWENGYLCTKRKGVLFTLDVECECYGYDCKNNSHEEWKNRERQKIHAIIANPHNIFINVSGNPGESNYINSSNHDSYWRDDGFKLIKETAYSMYHRVYARVPPEHTPNMINADFFLWDIFDKFIQPVEITCYANDHYESILKIDEIFFTNLFEN